MGAKIICTGPVSRRTKLYFNRHFSWAGGDGRLFEFAYSTLGTSPYHALARHYSGFVYGGLLRWSRYRRTLGTQPGCTQFTARFCDDSTDSFCERKEIDERISHQLAYENRRLGDNAGHCRAKCAVSG